MHTHAATARPPLPIRDRLRTLARMAVTPLVPDDFVELVAPLRATTRLRARIEDIRRETAGSVTVTLRPGVGWAGHRAGQYVRIGIDVDGVRRWRCYSLTGPARPDGLLTITVVALPGGIVSTFLVHRAAPGTLVELEQAAGDFVLPSPVPAASLFVSAGSGITPVIGMLRSDDAPRDVVVVHSARTPDDVVFGDELRTLARAGRIRLVERHTAVQGRLTPAALAGAVPDLFARETWACGPAGLLDDLEEHWSAAGHRERLRTERFTAARAPGGAGGTVTLARSGVAVTADGATSLLDAGEAAGALLPSGCRMGICFGCVVPLREGSVRDLRTGEPTTATPGDGVLVQTCVSAAAGPCTLDA